MERNHRSEHSDTQIAREVYCVVDESGQESAAKLAAVIAALETVSQAARSRGEWPDVPGVPRLRARISGLRDLAACVREVLPIIERDPTLHALSFVNPLRLAVDELGIAISPRVSRYLHRALRGTLSFSKTADADRVFRGLTHIRWVKRKEPREETRTHQPPQGARDV